MKNNIKESWTVVTPYGKCQAKSDIECRKIIGNTPNCYYYRNDVTKVN